MAEILPLHPKRILVIHTAFLGDIALASSFLAGLRACFPEAEIRVLTTPIGVKILEPNPWRIHFISYDKRGNDRGIKGFLRLRRELEAFSPDLNFCLHRSLRSALLARAAGGITWGFSEAAGSFLYQKKFSRMGYEYEADKNLALLKPFAEGLKISRYPKLYCSDEDYQEAQALLGDSQDFLAIAPSSVWATKRWPAERFAEVAHVIYSRYKLRPVIVGGKDHADLDAAKALRSFYRENFPNSSDLLDLTGRTSLGVLKAVLAGARIVISNDSAPLHIAIAMGAPVVGIFGPTTKSLGFFPLAEPGRAGVAELRDLDCRPCGLHGHENCPKVHFRCMLDLPSQSVIAEVEKILCR